MLHTIVYILFGSNALVIVCGGFAIAFGYLARNGHSLRRGRAATARYGPVRLSQTAILIACRNGASTIGAAVSHARASGVNVYLVSDASTVDTAELAANAGARVLTLTENVGKPAALLAAYRHFELGHRYRAIAVLDDDVMIEPDFMRRCLQDIGGDTGIVVGHCVSWWPESRRWNVWLANRAYGCWTYQAHHQTSAEHLQRDELHLGLQLAVPRRAVRPDASRPVAVHCGRHVLDAGDAPPQAGPDRVRAARQSTPPGPWCCSCRPSCSPTCCTGW